MATRIMKYNPAFLTEDELIASFAVRDRELQMITKVLEENTGTSNQHLLIIGPRGIGKTTLVLRAVADIRNSPELNEHWYPIVFGEESYEVFTPGEFWLEALFHLSEQTNAQQWKRVYTELKEETDDDRLHTRALAQLLDFADSTGKRVLLVVENFNMLLVDQLNDDDAWAIRHTLLNEKRVMLLATATSWVDHMENSGKAMFEVFRHHDLKPLNEKECCRLWASQTGNEPPLARMRPIQILTGGSPRLITIVASFATDLSLKQLMNELMQLVDDHTDYFKSRIDNMAPVERKVYLALAEIWDPAQAKTVAKQARLNVNKTSSLLNRLVNRGMAMVAEKKGRIKWYQISERLYNIYYLMRRRGAPSRRVHGIVNFMVSFYEPEELVLATRDIAQEAGHLEPSECESHYLTYSEILNNIEKQSIKNEILHKTPKEFFQSDFTPQNIIKLALESGIVQGKNEQVKPLKSMHSIIKQIDDIWALSNDPKKLLVVEKALREMIDSEPGIPHARAQLGQLLHEKIERYEEAEAAYRKAIEIEPNFGLFWEKLFGLMKGGHSKKLKSSKDCYKLAKKIIDRTPDDAGTLNAISWSLFKHVPELRLPEIELWARKAVTLAPGDNNVRHTFASILASNRNLSEAIANVEIILSDKVYVQGRTEEVTDVIITIAALGKCIEALNLVQSYAR